MGSHGGKIQPKQSYATCLAFQRLKLSFNHLRFTVEFWTMRNITAYCKNGFVLMVHAAFLAK